MKDTDDISIAQRVLDYTEVINTASLQKNLPTQKILFVRHRVLINTRVVVDRSSIHRVLVNTYVTLIDLVFMEYLLTQKSLLINLVMMGNLLKQLFNC